MTHAVTDVRFEHRANGFGLGEAAPRLSWRLAAPAGDSAFEQAAYEVELRLEGTAGPEVRRVDSTDQVLVPWPFAPLASRARGDVRVRVRAGDGADWTAWSEPAAFEAALLSAHDWVAEFISPRTESATAPVLVRTFELARPAARARLYITAHGVFTAFVNGVRVGDHVLAPGWTSYRHRLAYEVHDIGPLLQPGANRIEVLLGNGWFRGRLGFTGERGHYGDRLALLAQIEADGEVVAATDGTWAAASSNVTADDLYDGQAVDHRLPWAAGSEPVEVVEAGRERLMVAPGPPVRAIQTVPAADVRFDDDAAVIDFGQNVVGWVRLRPTGAAAGTEVVVRHAEVLDGKHLATGPLRTAEATDRYTLDGSDEAVEPALTFHGFRYAEVRGLGPLSPAAAEAVVVGTDLARTGWFECSDAEVNRLHENVVWSTRGNFLSVPTDCPQRDERLGWTADLQLFAPTACFLFDVAGFLQNWLADLAAEQRADGSVPLVIPDVVGLDVNPAGWGDAAVVVPWTLYERSGDAGVLRAQFDSMRAWVDFAARAVGPSGVVTGGFQFNDWLDPDAPPDQPWAAKTDAGVLATACLARTAALMSRAADVVGDARAAADYGALAARTRAAFRAEFTTGSGRVLSETATAYAMALAWDLLDGPRRATAGVRLADRVRMAGFRIPTGFLGTPLIQDALCATGQERVAHRLLLQRACPSWLYPVTMGATTMWERWDSMLPDGSINPGSMTSFNHYALGAVADWLHRCVAGLSPLAPGYREVLIRPVPPDGMDWASARHLSPYGEIEVAWRRAGGRLEAEARIPPGTLAVVDLPGGDGPARVGPGSHGWSVPDLRRDPSAPLEPGATVRDAVDHPGLYAELTALLVARGIAQDEPHAASLLAPHFDEPAASFDGLMPATILAGALDARPDIAAVIARHTR